MAQPYKANDNMHKIDILHKFNLHIKKYYFTFE